MPSGVRERIPLTAYLIPTLSSPTIDGISSRACSICGVKSSWVNGNSVGVSAASSTEGMSSGSYRIGRCAYEPTSRPVPSCRSYMFVSMSRTIGKSMSPFVSANQWVGPMSIIWCTAGVSGIEAPAMCASFGLQTPQAITTMSVSMSPPVVRRRANAPVLDVDTDHFGVGEHREPPALLAALAHDRAGTKRVDDADGRAVEAAEDHGLVDERDELLHLGRRHERDRLDSPRLRGRDPPRAAPASAPRSARPRCRPTR